MSVTLKMQGLQEFRRALRDLPADLADEAAPLVSRAAEEVGRQTIDGYPEGPTGNLRRRVRVTVESSRFGVSGVVRSTAPHAHLFEGGTKVRRTAKGHNRGRMPAARPDQKMVPKAVRSRSRMVSSLVGLLRRAGFEVRT